MEQTTANDASVRPLGEDWFDPLEAGVTLLHGSAQVAGAGMTGVT